MSRGRKKQYSAPLKQARSVKHPEYRTLDVYRKSATVEELQTMRRALAKQANQRIVRLERAESAISGEKYNTFGAVIDAYEYLNYSGRRRFSEVKGYLKDQNQLRREITVLQGFLSRKTSTVKGIRDIERKREKAFKEKGLKFANTKEFYDFINSQTFKDLVSTGFTSEQIVDAYDLSRRRKKDTEVIKDIEKALTDFRTGEKKVSLKNLEKTLDIKLIDLR